MPAAFSICRTFQTWESSKRSRWTFMEKNPPALRPTGSGEPQTAARSTFGSPSAVTAILASAIRSVRRFEPVLYAGTTFVSWAPSSYTVDLDRLIEPEGASRLAETATLMPASPKFSIRTCGRFDRSEERTREAFKPTGAAARESCPIVKTPQSSTAPSNPSLAGTIHRKKFMFTS